MRGGDIQGGEGWGGGGGLHLFTHYTFHVHSDAPIWSVHRLTKSPCWGKSAVKHARTRRMISTTFNLFLAGADVHNSSSADRPGCSQPGAQPPCCRSAAMGRPTLLFPSTVNVHASPASSFGCLLSSSLLSPALFTSVQTECVSGGHRASSFLLFKGPTCKSWRHLLVWRGTESVCVCF